MRSFMIYIPHCILLLWGIYHLLIGEHLTAIICSCCWTKVIAVFVYFESRGSILLQTETVHFSFGCIKQHPKSD
jgi:hypothetical protein